MDVTSEACPLCGHHTRVLAATWAEWDASLDDRDDGPMRRAASAACGIDQVAPNLMTCLGCGSVGMEPIPGDDHLAKFYQSYHMTDNFVRKAKKKIARARKRLLLLSLLAPRRAPKRRFLEIGASIGTAAEAARRAGYDAEALEIDPDAIARGQALHPGIKFQRGMLEDVHGNESFELLYGAEVIEHVRDPGAFLDCCHRLLVPGGLLFLTTPDCGHPKRPEPILRWNSVKPPEHIHLFTKKGMAALLEAHGFPRHLMLPQAKPGMRVLAWRP